MRGFLVIAMFAASLTSATLNELNVGRESTVDARASDAINTGEHFVNNSWWLDESLMADAAQVIDAPCDSIRVVSDTDHPMPDII